MIHQRNFLMAQQASERPAILHQDNMSTIKLLLRGNAASNRSRHIEIHNYWLKDQVERGVIEVKWTPTLEMVSDILTKPLQGELFKSIRQLLLNWQDAVED
jgi:hypothetical protein